jgi:predicted peroxiredoxin
MQHNMRHLTDVATQLRKTAVQVYICQTSYLMKMKQEQILRKLFLISPQTFTSHAASKVTADNYEENKTFTMVSSAFLRLRWKVEVRYW